jgi:hypothetical protein
MTLELLASVEQVASADQILDAVIVIVVFVAGWITRHKRVGQSKQDGPNGPLT